jgi:transposase InsO family protein
MPLELFRSAIAERKQVICIYKGHYREVCPHVLSWKGGHPYVLATAPRSPWQNGHTERLIGSIRRECLDHVVVFGERHLRYLLLSYMAYYNSARTHLSLNKDAPLPRVV